MLLFKNGLKNLLKDYIQFSIYIILISIAVIFTATFGISASNLLRTNNQVSSHSKHHDYSFRYTSSKYKSNDTQTLSPWFAFDSDLVKDYKNNYFPTLTIGGNDGVLKAYTFKDGLKENKSSYDSSIYIIGDKGNDGKKWINFHFGDVEPNVISSEKDLSYKPTSEKDYILNFTKEQKIEKVRSMEFGSFYRFNKNSNAFKRSLIGQLYEKNDYFQGKLSKKTEKTALDIFDYMFYVNNSSITSVIKSSMVNYYEKLKDDKVQKMNKYINGDGINGDKTKDDIIKNGYNGRIGNIVKGDKDDQNSYFICEDINFKLNGKDLDPDNTLKKFGSYLIKNFSAYNLFINPGTNNNPYNIKSNPLISRDLFKNYYSLLGDLSDFNIDLTSEVVMWDSSGKKFRYVSAFYNEKNEKNENIVKFYNRKNYTIYESLKVDDGSLFTEKSFMVSSGYAKYNNMELGDEYEIFPGQGKNGALRLDAIGVDSQNVYPSIYEEDLLTNQQNEAIFYISNDTFRTMFNETNNQKNNIVDDSKYQDVSRGYMYYHGKIHEKKDNLAKFKLYAADNLVNINDVKEQQEAYAGNGSLSENSDLSRINVQSYKDTNLINLRSTLFGSVTKLFLLIAVVFCVIFLLIILFVVYNIVRKILISQRSQIGTLKSLGTTNNKILVNYVMYMTLPIIITVPIGWAISVFLQTPIMNIFEYYFNIPSMLTIDWKFLLIMWLGFFLVVGFMVYMTAYLTVRQSPLTLLQPSKSSHPNLFLVRIFSRIKYINFTSKLRGVIVSVSLKDIFIFLTVMFISSIILMVSVATPSILSTMSNEYYRNVRYNNDYTYSYNTPNNPLSRYSFYNLNNNITQSTMDASTFSGIIKTKEGKEVTLFGEDKASKNYWKENSGDYKNYFEKMLINNLFTFKGNVLSVGIMDKMVDHYESLFNKGEENLVLTYLNQLTCEVIPKLFNQKPLSCDNKKRSYKESIKEISNNILPSSIKQLWDNDDSEFKNFTYGFGSIPFNSNEDELFTKFDARILDGSKDGINVLGYGLDKESNFKGIGFKNRSKLFESMRDDEIPIIINRKLKLKGYNIGSKINLATEQNIIELKSENNSFTPVNNDWWSYSDSKNTKDVFSMDLSKLTLYEQNDDKLSEWNYRDNDKLSNYNKLQNIQLKIPKKLFNQELLKEVNNKYKEYSGFDVDTTNENITVKPFDVRMYRGDKWEPLQITNLLGGTNNWWNIALKEGLFVNNKLSNESKINYRVVDIVDTYDQPKIFVDQEKANEILGYKNPKERVKVGQTSVNIWSNAKMSSNDMISDQLQRIIFQSKDGNITTDGFKQYMATAIGKTDYMKVRKEATSNLISSATSLSIVFVSISIISAIIVIYLITDLFVGKYKRFMNYMRIQGYSMREVNSIIMWIFLPLTLIGIVLAEVLVTLIIYTAIPKILISLNIAVPLSFSWTVFPIILVSGLLIFAIAYFVIIYSMSKTKLASLIGVS